MSWHSAEDPLPGDRFSCDAIRTLIVPRSRDLGSFAVRRVGLGSVLGYLLAGLAIGPFGLGLFRDAHAILHVAELGVVMFLDLAVIAANWGLILADVAA